MAAPMRGISARNISPLLLSTSTAECVLHQRIILLTYLLIGTEWKKSADVYMRPRLRARGSRGSARGSNKTNNLFFAAFYRETPETGRRAHFDKLSGLAMSN